VSFEIIRDIIEYIELRFEFWKTKAQRDALTTATYIAVRLTIVLILTMFALMLNLSVAFLVGDWLGKIYLGFLVVAGFYLLVGMVLIYYREALSKYLFNKIFQSRLEIFHIDQYTLDLDQLNGLPPQEPPNPVNNGSQATVRREDATDQEQI